MVQERFDAVVVGAGPAGLAAACTMAGRGLKVAVIERGEYPGSKNVMGGVLYRQPTQEVFPGFWKEAPLERTVVESGYWLMTGSSVARFSYRTAEFASEPYNAFTVLRARFDRWMGRQAEKAGALLICETTVEDILKDGGKVTGVRTGRSGGDLYAGVVVIAEGANSLLAQKALGMQKPLTGHDFAVAVKEVISLPKEKIEDRFSLEDGQGATIEVFGESTLGMLGTGFIYTNRESISIGVGALVSQMVENRVNPNDLLENFKRHPAVRPLIGGGETREYLAHMIPEGGYRAVPRLYGDGVVIVGDAAQLVNGLHREGSNLALASGRIAGEVIAQAGGDPGKSELALYQRRLEDSFVIKDLKKYRDASSHLEKNPEPLSVYPGLADAALREFFTVDSIPKREKQKKMVKKVLSGRSAAQIAGDAFRLWRVLK